MEHEQFSEIDEILLVYDDKEKKVSAVKGIDKKGNLQTVPPKKENQNDFIRINKQGDPLENFISNYKRQLNNPTRFTFFTSRLNVVGQATKAFLGAIKDGIRERKISEINMQIEKLIQKQKKMETPDQTPASAVENEKKQNYRFNPDNINWDSLNKFGITQENLPPSTLETMLEGRKSEELHRISADFGNVKLQTEARLSFRNMPDGSIALAIHGVRKTPELDKPFFGHKFTDEDKKNLLETGNAGRLIETKDFRTKEPNLVYVSVDKLTNELVALKAEHIRLPEEIKGVKLNEEQKQALHEGKAVFVEGMTSKAGKPFSAYIQVNAEKRGIEFRFGNRPKQEQSQEQNNKVTIPQKMGGVDLSKEQQKELRDGKTIYVANLTDKKGEKYSAYVKVDAKKGKLSFYAENPDIAKKEGKTKEITPDNRHKAQVNANNEGKKSEANKNVQEPFKEGQNHPAKPKGKKI